MASSNNERIEENINDPSTSNQNCYVLERSNCSICLSEIKNAAIIDSCKHRFCIKCILDWCKIKNECPLCKETFLYMYEYVQNLQEFTTWYKNILENLNVACFVMSENLFHVYKTAKPKPTAKTPVDFRQKLYENNLWVMPFLYNQEQESKLTDEYFKQNRLHLRRLIPWIRRELKAIFTRHFVSRESKNEKMEHIINTIIAEYPIKSKRLFRELSTYLEWDTHHFIHEFVNYFIADCPIDQYDERAVYVHPSHGIIPVLDSNRTPFFLLSNDTNVDTPSLYVLAKEIFPGSANKGAVNAEENNVNACLQKDEDCIITNEFKLSYDKSNLPRIDDLEIVYENIKAFNMPYFESNNVSLIKSSSLTVIEIKPFPVANIRSTDRPASPAITPEMVFAFINHIRSMSDYVTNSSSQSQQNEINSSSSQGEGNSSQQNGANSLFNNITSSANVTSTSSMARAPNRSLANNLQPCNPRDGLNSRAQTEAISSSNNIALSGNITNNSSIPLAPNRSMANNLQSCNPRDGLNSRVQTEANNSSNNIALSANVTNNSSMSLAPNRSMTNNLQTCNPRDGLNSCAQNRANSSSNRITSSANVTNASSMFLAPNRSMTNNLQTYDPRDGLNSHAQTEANSSSNNKALSGNVTNNNSMPLSRKRSLAKNMQSRNDYNLRNRVNSKPQNASDQLSNNISSSGNISNANSIYLANRSLANNMHPCTSSNSRERVISSPQNDLTNFSIHISYALQNHIHGHDSETEKIRPRKKAKKSN